MTAILDPRPRHRPGTGEQRVDALRTALHALRNVHDEQMRMWEAFYRVSTWDPRPEAFVREPRAGGGPGSAAGQGQRL